MAQPQQSLDPSMVRQQFSEIFRVFNEVSERCFADCVYDFTGRKLTDKEDECATNCFTKYLKMSERISQRFQEFQLVQNEGLTKVA